MANFIEINKINSKGEKGVALVLKEDIVGIKANQVENDVSYDENGNVKSETPKPLTYTLKLVGQNNSYSKSFHIDQVEYDRLKVELTK